MVIRNGCVGGHERICISDFYVINIYADSKIMNYSDEYLNDGNMIDR